MTEESLDVDRVSRMTVALLALMWREFRELEPIEIGDEPSEPSEEFLADMSAIISLAGGWAANFTLTDVPPGCERVANLAAEEAVRQASAAMSTIISGAMSGAFAVILEMGSRWSVVDREASLTDVLQSVALRMADEASEQ